MPYIHSYPRQFGRVISWKYYCYYYYYHLIGDKQAKWGWISYQWLHSSKSQKQYKSLDLRVYAFVLPRIRYWVLCLFPRGIPPRWFKASSFGPSTLQPHCPCTCLWRHWLESIVLVGVGFQVQQAGVQPWPCQKLCTLEQVTQSPLLK